MYIEQKSGYADNGPARIGRVSFSKSGKSIKYAGKEFRSLKGSGVCGGNYFDVETGDEYWISGVKKDQSDRHWAGSGSVYVDEDCRDEYYKQIGKTPR